MVAICVAYYPQVKNAVKSHVDHLANINSPRTSSTNYLGVSFHSTLRLLPYMCMSNLDPSAIYLGGMPAVPLRVLFNRPKAPKTCSSTFPATPDRH